MSDFKLNIKEFIKDIGISVENTDELDVSLFELAMTHSSYSIDNNLGHLHNNERLEFYGDAALKLACSKFLYEKFPNKDEGFLSAYRAFLVSDAFLSKYATDINLGKYLFLSDRPDLKTEKTYSTILACAFEALLSVLFVQLGFDVVYGFLEKFFKNYIVFVEENILKLNAKSALQEYTQGIDAKLPEYEIVSEQGKLHERVFEVVVNYKGKAIGHGTGKSKKEAEQAAAYDACVKFGVIHG